MQAEVKEFIKKDYPRESSRNKYNLLINERLKKARNRKKMSSARVVTELKRKGVSIGHSTLQGYEANENSLNHRYPSIPVIMELANFYGCSLDYLFGLSDKFKSTTLSKEIDLNDILEGKNSVTFNGKRLSKHQREALLKDLDTNLATKK